MIGRETARVLTHTPQSGVDNWSHLFDAPLLRPVATLRFQGPSRSRDAARKGAPGFRQLEIARDVNREICPGDNFRHSLTGGLSDNAVQIGQDAKAITRAERSRSRFWRPDGLLECSTEPAAQLSFFQQTCSERQPSVSVIAPVVVIATGEFDEHARLITHGPRIVTRWQQHDVVL